MDLSKLENMDIFYFCIGQIREAIWKVSPYMKRVMLDNKTNQWKKHL